MQFHTSLSSSILNSNRHRARRISKPGSWHFSLTFAASVATLLFFFAIITLTNQPSPASNHEVKLHDPQAIALAPITLENVQKLTQLTALGQGYLKNVTWSPDGQTLVLTTSMGIFLYDVDDLLKPQHFIDIVTTYTKSPLFSEDGNQLVAQDGLQGLVVWDRKTHQERRFSLAEYGVRAIWHVALTPDGEVVAVVEEGSFVLYRYQRWHVTISRAITGKSTGQFSL